MDTSETLGINCENGSASKPISIPILSNLSVLTTYEGLQNGLSSSCPSKSEPCPYRYDDMLTNLTGALVSGSINNLTLNDNRSIAELSSCRELQRSGCNIRYGRSTSIVSKTSQSKDSVSKLESL